VKPQCLAFPARHSPSLLEQLPCCGYADESVEWQDDSVENHVGFEIGCGDYRNPPQERIAERGSQPFLLEYG
jgi:hypothetical protein